MSDSLLLSSSDVVSNIWCHSCGMECPGQINGEGELTCSICNGTFVENLGQGIENFIGLNNVSSLPGPDIPPAPPLNSTSNFIDGTAPGNEAIQQILGRILGMGIQVGPTQQASLLDVVQQAAAESGRPVEIVVRQASTPADLNAISSLLGISATGNAAIQQHPIGTTRSNFPLIRQGIRAGRADYLDIIESMLGEGILHRRTGDNGSTGNGNNHGSDLEQILHHILMNEQSRAGTPPASEELINLLKVVEIAAESQADALGECLISFEKFRVGDEAVMLPCGHAYVPSEIKRWLRMHSTCPCCRVIINMEMFSSANDSDETNIKETAEPLEECS